MPQFRGAKIYVLNNGTNKTVRQVWRAFGGMSGSGAFSGGLTWPGSGAGTIVSSDAGQIEFYRTAGALPAVNTAITSAGGLIFTISGFPSTNLSVTNPVCGYPAGFNDALNPQGPIAANQDFIIDGQPRHIVSATIASDSFDLTLPWSGNTLTNIECVINRDFTANFQWILPKSGSRIPWAILEELIKQIDDDMAAIAGPGGTPPTNFQTLTITTPPWTVVNTAPAYSNIPSAQSTSLRGAVEATSTPVSTGSTICTLPSGSRPAARIDLSYGGEQFAIRTDGRVTYETPGQVNVFTGVISLACTFRADGT